MQTRELDHPRHQDVSTRHGDQGAKKVRALHVLVPEEAHLHARRAALDSRLSFKAFMARLLLAAKPIPADDRA